MVETIRTPRLPLVAIALLSLVMSSACGDDGECADGIDNDTDGLIDDLDPGCAVNGNAEFPEPPQCADGIDNDSDGTIDGADPGCENATDDDEFNEPVAECKDGLDNDGDGFTDFPSDPGCALSLDDEEQDDCPDGEGCPACGNRMDDDADGVTDYPEDPGCNNAGDTDEFNSDPSICGASVPVTLLPADGIAEGTFNSSGSNDLISLDCGGNGTEVAFEFTLNEASALSITTDFPETTTDTVVYLREMCRLPDTEIACNDDNGPSNASLMDSSTHPILANVPAGTYYLVVDTINSTGNFKVQVDGFSPQGGDCDPMDLTPCPPGLVCRPLTPGADPTCELYECEDGIDNDSDGFTDWPNDPACAATGEGGGETETSDCAWVTDTWVGTECPQCADNDDNDGDGFNNFSGLVPAPANPDPGCESAGDDLELECEDETDPVTAIDSFSVSDSTVGLSNDLDPGCGFSNAPEVVYTLAVPGELATLQVDTIGSDLDTILYIRADDCSSADLDCDDEGGPSFGESQINLTDVAAGIYLIVVDGYSSGSGDYTLNVLGEIKGGESCNPADEAAGFLVCEAGFACQGATGSETCAAAECSDTIDNEPDGDTDWPNDPGCSSPSDTDESDEQCPGMNCPECSNGSDDDGDGLIDHISQTPMGESPDPGCTGAGDDDELDECTPGVPATLLENDGASGTTGPFSNPSNYQGSCTTASSPEDVYVYRVDAPGLNSLTITTETMSTSDDTVLYVRKDDCGDTGAEVGCVNQQNGGESLTIAPALPGFYYIFVDGDFDASIPYDLSVSGVLAVGAACPVTNFTCPLGTTCSGTCN